MIGVVVLAGLAVAALVLAERDRRGPTRHTIEIRYLMSLTSARRPWRWTVRRLDGTRVRCGTARTRVAATITARWIRHTLDETDDRTTCDVDELAIRRAQAASRHDHPSRRTPA